MERYEAAKRRREEKDLTEETDALEAVVSETGEVCYLANTTTVATQTDLTVMDLSALEKDNQKRTVELAELRVAKGYPSQEDLKSSEKVLRFYTGLSSFAVLMAVFRLVSVAVTEGGAEGGAAKLCQFEYLR